MEFEKSKNNDQKKSEQQHHITENTLKYTVLGIWWMDKEYSCVFKRNKASGLSTG